MYFRVSRAQQQHIAYANRLHMNMGGISEVSRCCELLAIPEILFDHCLRAQHEFGALAVLFIAVMLFNMAGNFRWIKKDLSKFVQSKVD